MPVVPLEKVLKAHDGQLRRRVDRPGRHQHRPCACTCAALRPARKGIAAACAMRALLCLPYPTSLLPSAQPPSRDRNARGGRLQHSATWCSRLQHSATWGSRLQHSATWGSRLQHSATWCNRLQHSPARCSGATRCYTRAAAARDGRIGWDAMGSERTQQDLRREGLELLQQLGGRGVRARHRARAVEVIGVPVSVRMGGRKLRRSCRRE